MAAWGSEQKGTKQMPSYTAKFREPVVCPGLNKECHGATEATAKHACNKHSVTH